MSDPKDWTFIVEDFCWKRRKVTVQARTREAASKKLQEKSTGPIAAAWVPANGERHP